MQLPATSAAINFLLDPARKFVQFNQSAYPALQVQSVLNRATQFPILQLTGANQPTWSANAIQGAYSYINNPGVLGGFTPAGIDGLTFSGSQYLPYNSLASVFATPESAFTVVSVVSPLSAGGTVWSLQDTSDSYGVHLTYGGGNFSLSEVNSNGTYSTSFASSAAPHVVTAIRSGGTLTLRVDGSVAGTAAVVAGTAVPTTFTIGAQVAGSISSQFHGSLGVIAAYTGSADIYGVETYLLQDIGVIRGPSVGINSGF